MDTTKERILEYALDGMSKDLQTLERTLGKVDRSYQELYALYNDTYDNYEYEVEKNII